VKEATVEELARVEGFGPRQAALVHDFFRRPDAPPAEAEAPESTEAEIDAALAAEEAGG
jgi:excinuclease ABC subunit C